MESDKARSIYSAIVLNNAQREHSTLSRFACRSHRARRVKKEKVPDKENIRPAFAHDADRIIHSLAYARYIDKTQVFSLFENDHITHRVLHVQLVSKIARVIGRCLRLNEDLIEAIALGHDLGHVPYGHDGEAELNKICGENGVGAFCHNAQSVRFLTEIEMKGEGLNLTLQVLDGILAHNGELLSQSYAPERNKTWETHMQEHKQCFVDAEFSKKIVPMTLEGCVVRISDVIGYIGRDIEDAIAVNLIRRRDIPTSVAAILGRHNRKIIDKLVMDLVKNSYDRDHLIFSQEVFSALQELREFNMKEIYQNPRIKTESTKVCRMFRYLFQECLSDLESERRTSPLWRDFLGDLPDSYRERTPPARIIVDFISGMTDDYFNNHFEERVVPKRFGYRLEKLAALPAP
jgi:dGTPase